MPRRKTCISCGGTHESRPTERVRDAPVSMRKEDTPVNGLLEKLLTLPELRELAAEVHKTRCCAAVTGLSPVHRAMVAAALAEETKRPLLLLLSLIHI